MPDAGTLETSNKIILAMLVIWLFLIRMIYQERARWPRHQRPPVPGWERVLVLLTSLWLAPVMFDLFTPWIDPLRFSLPDWARKAGAGIFSLGVLLYWYAHEALGRSWSAYSQVKPHHELVTRGPYRFVRHPMYLAVFICGIGMALLTANWLITVTYFVPVLALYLLRTPVEEARLAGAFGEEYQAYRARTGALLPRLLKPQSTSPDRPH